MGRKYNIDLEIIAKSREEYQSEEYRSGGWPAAPAVMVEEEIAGQGPNISEETLEKVIRRHLGLPTLR